MRRVALVITVLAALAAAVFFGIKAFSPLPVALSVVAGSENKMLESMIMDWAAHNNTALTIITGTRPV